MKCAIAASFSAPQAVNVSAGLTSNLDYKAHSEIIKQLTVMGLYDTKIGWKPESVGHYARLAAEHDDHQSKRDEESYRCGCQGCLGRNIQAKISGRAEGLRAIYSKQSGIPESVRESDRRQSDVRVSGPKQSESVPDTRSHCNSSCGVPRESSSDAGQDLVCVKVLSI